MEINDLPKTVGASQQALQSPEPKELDKEAFMKLLVAQLQNQDPLDPMDSRDFVSQLSDLTSVEKLAGIEDRLGGIENASAQSAGLDAHRLIGKSISADTSQGYLGQLGTVEIPFVAEQGADNATLRVRNAYGDVIREIQVSDVHQGPNKLVWDGLSTSGERQAAGMYYFDIKASSADGINVPAELKIQGVVTGVSFESGNAELELGDTKVTLDRVNNIY